jgi:hypothetical protein
MRRCPRLIQMLTSQITALVVVDQHLVDRRLAQIPVDHHARRPGVVDLLHSIVAVDRRDQSRRCQNKAIDALGQEYVDVGLLLDRR